MKVSVRAASSNSLWDFTATTSHGNLQNHTAALLKHYPLVDFGRISPMETFRVIRRLCLKRCPLVDLGQVWNSFCIPLWETHVEHTSQMNAPYLKDIQPTFAVHGLSPLQSKVSRDKMSEIIAGHIKTMKLSNVLMVSSLLLNVWLWNYIHLSFRIRIHSNANLSFLSQAIDIITHELALPYLGKNCHIS